MLGMRESYHKRLEVELMPGFDAFYLHEIHRDGETHFTGRLGVFTSLSTAIEIIRRRMAKRRAGL